MYSNAILAWSRAQPQPPEKLCVVSDCNMHSGVPNECTLYQ